MTATASPKMSGQWPVASGQETAASGAPSASSPDLRVPSPGTSIVLRHATADEAPTIHALIEANLESGHLLPRALDELRVHAPRFLVAVEGDRIVACGELAPLSPSVAEVRSLVVADGSRGAGVGTRLVEALEQRARREGFATLCAFTHQPEPFVRLGFSIVPHVWVPEKIATDCHGCPLFRRCRQYAMVYPLARPLRREPPGAARAATATASGLSPLPLLA